MLSWAGSGFHAAHISNCYMRRAIAMTPGLPIPKPSMFIEEIRAITWPSDSVSTSASGRRSLGPKGRVALEVLLERLPRMRLLPGQPIEHHPHFFLRGLKQLVLEWEVNRE